MKTHPDFLSHDDQSQVKVPPRAAHNSELSPGQGDRVVSPSIAHIIQEIGIQATHTHSLVHKHAPQGYTKYTNSSVYPPMSEPKPAFKRFG